MLGTVIRLSVFRRVIRVTGGYPPVRDSARLLFGPTSCENTGRARSLRPAWTDMSSQSAVTLGMADEEVQPVEQVHMAHASI